MKLLKTMLLCAVLAPAAVGAAADTAQPSSIQGVWRVAEVRSNGRVNKKPEPGLYIITSKHYSIVLVNQPRPKVDDLAAATDSELRSVWAPLVSHSGTYAISSNGHVTWSPIVAKNPAFIGSHVEVPYAVNGNELWVKDATG